MLLIEKNVVNVIKRMRHISKHKYLIQHEGEIYRVLGEHMEDRVDKTRLGLLVKWYGGDKVLGYGDKLLICETIKDAILE